MATYIVELRLAMAVACTLPACLFVWPVRHTQIDESVTAPMNPPSATGPTDPTGPIDPTAPGSNACDGVDDPTAPALHFSDLRSGPNHGGESDLGVYVTLYGRRFGATQGTSRVLLGGVEVARYVVWNDTSARLPTGLQRTTVQLGAQTSSGNLTVEVAGKMSNPLPFTVRDGSIFFVDASAPTGGDGSLSTPFSTLSSLKSHLEVGATAYLRGSFTDVDPDSTQNANLFLSSSNAPAGTPAAPITLIGVPGGSASLEAPIGVDIDSAGGGDYYDFANISFHNASAPLALSNGGHRVVGSRLESSALTRNQYAISLFDKAHDIQILGNVFSGNQGGLLVTLAFDKSFTTLRIAWNEMATSPAGYPTLALWACDGPEVAGNRFANAGIAITLNDGVSGARVYNNIMTAMDGSVLVNNTKPGAASAKIQHNTFYNAGTITTGAGNLTAVQIDNNILSPQSASYFEDNSSLMVAHSNFYDTTLGGGPPSTIDTAAKGGNPSFANATSSRFDLRSGSDAIDQAVDVGICADAIGIARHRGPDMGALEAP